MSVEQNLIPYTAVNSLGRGPVLILAPHPDDEVFGCGGAILRHVAADDPIKVIIVTDGGFQELPDDAQESYIQQRLQESIDAARILGYGEPVFWGMRDRELQYGELLIGRLLDAVKEHKAQWVYAPSIFEVHPDHRALGMSAVESVRRLGSGITLAMYEVGIPLPPNRLLDITDLQNKKRQAMACFTSQLARQAYDRHVEALNRFRTYTLPPEVEAAEAYLITEGEQLRDNFLGIYASEAERQRRLQIPLDAFNQPLVSILVRTIGRQQLRETLDSIALQTYPNIEVVVADAQGKDDLKLGKWCGRFPLRLYSKSVPLARSAAANLTLDNAQGDYLIFLDDDDWFEPNHITSLVAVLSKTSNHLAAYTGVRGWRQGAAYPIREEVVFNEPFDPLRLMWENYIPIHAVLFKKEVLEKGCKFDTGLDIYEDWDFWLQVSKEGELFHVDQISAFYRDSGTSNVGGIHHHSEAARLARIKIFEKWKNYWTGEQVNTLLMFFLNQMTANTSLREEVDIAREIIRDRDLQLADLRDRWGERDQLLIQREHQLVKQNQQLAEQEQQLAEQKQQLAEQKQQLAEQEQQLAEQKQQLAEQKQQLMQLYDRLAERDEEIAGYKREVENYNKTISSIYDSRSWRMTRPSRWLGWQARRIKGSLQSRTVSTNESINPDTQQIIYNVETFHILKTSFGNAKLLVASGWCWSPARRRPVQLQLLADDRVVAEITCDAVREDVALAIDAPTEDKTSLVHSGFKEMFYLEEGISEVSLYSPEDNLVLIHSRIDDIHVEVVQQEFPRLATKESGTIALGRRLFNRARGKVRAKDMLSIQKWRYWYQKAKQEYQRFNLEDQWTAESRFGEQLTPYQAYIRNNQIRPHIRSLLEKVIEGCAYQPLISILMPVYNVDAKWLIMAIESVREQIYPHWELCIADDASTKEQTRQALKRYQGDPRIKIVFRKKNGHICKATNTAAEQAQGEFVALMDQDDLLPPHALFEIFRLLQTHPTADLIYSDEDKIDGEGNRYDPDFKPDWSPTLLLGYNYINHLTCIRRSLFEAVGRFREGYEGAQDYDLLLRLTNRTNRIFHIPKVLYHWRAIPESTASAADIKPIVKLAADAALKDHLERCNIQAEIYQPTFATVHRLPINQLDTMDLDNAPSVDIIIPTYNQHRVLKRCIDSLHITTYKNYRIFVVDNGSDEAETLAYLQDLQKQGIAVIRIPNAGNRFSFSQVINDAVKLSTADLVVFLNNDTEVLEPRWLNRMICYFQLPGVGVTGGRLLYPDSTLQHAGVLLKMGKDNAPGHAFHRHPAKQLSYFFLADTARDCAAVTGACLLTSRTLFLENGGFNQEQFRVSMNDIDYCLRLQDKGLRCVYVPGAELFHFEGLTRSKEDDPKELADFKKIYGGQNDSYYNPNLSRDISFAVDVRCTLDYEEYRDKPLKVVFYTHNLNFEGAPSVIINLTRGLKDRGKIAPILVSSQDGPARSLVEEAGIPCQILTPSGTENILQGWPTVVELEETIQHLVAFLQQERPDVVVANVLNGFFVVEAASRLHIPSLWLIHESYDPIQMLRNINSFALNMCEQAFLKAHSVVFVSRETSELYQRYNKNRNFTVVYNGLRQEVIKEVKNLGQKQQARQQLRIAAQKKMILSVGTVCERKNQEILVKAIALLAKRRDDFCCYIVGARPSPYLTHIKRLIKREDVSDRILLITETSDVHTYYQAADIFAFTSLNESYSLTILEAMAFGLPIVTTPCYGVAEQVRFGTNALGFPFGDVERLVEQLEILLNDEGKRQRLGRNSQEMLRYMQNYEDMLSQYQQLIEGAWQVGDVLSESSLALPQEFSAKHRTAEIHSELAD